MTAIPKPRAILDRKTLLARAETALEPKTGEAKARAAVLELVKEAYRTGWDEVQRRFAKDGIGGIEAARQHAFLVDQLVRTLYDLAATRLFPALKAPPDHLAIVATGGYGRGRLAPFSDVDLMFLLPKKISPRGQRIVEFMLYILWDLGLKVGHATRTADEAIRLSKSDLTIRTSLLEARWVWGECETFDDFRARFGREIVAGSGRDFVEAKLAERDARLKRMGDSRYVLEPNIKEGKGGLRDLQTLFWIVKYIHGSGDADALVAEGVLTAEDARVFARADSFLWTVRFHLHHLAGRAEERLSFDAQKEIARGMNYRDRSGSRGVERFMKYYFLIAKDVGDLTRIVCAVLEEEQKKSRFRLRADAPLFAKPHGADFRIEGNRMAFTDEAAISRDPVNLLRLFREAQRLGLDVHPRAVRLVARNIRLADRRLRADPEANRIFLDILTDRDSAEAALTWLNETGVFGRFIPDFGRVVAQMQYDMYHVYTVDEHTIRAIGILNRIEQGAYAEDHPVSSAIIHELQSRRALYVALLLHDIAKGRGGDHSEIGAEIANTLGPRLGLSEWETETVSWLVLHHLLMSRTAFKRDLDDAKTIADFVALVQSPERLRLLMILTVADIRAVGPQVWNAWKAKLLRELYFRALESMTGGEPAERRSSRVEAAKAALKARLAAGRESAENNRPGGDARARSVDRAASAAGPAAWTPLEIEDHLGRGAAAYWLAFEPDELVHHAGMIRAAEREGRRLVVETRAGPERAATEVLVYTPDHPGLFAALAGAFALAGANVVDARVTTLANSMALDVFSIQDMDGNAFADPERIVRLKRRIEDTLLGRTSSNREMETAGLRGQAARLGAFTVPPRVLIDNKASAINTVIEINGRDRPGFLRDVTGALTQAGLQISSAHISTYGERVVDVFYVRDVFGLKVENQAKLDAIRAKLLAAIAPGLSVGRPRPPGASAP
ncbi:MAG: [protein-PII] uridylyltransferase [Rhodospirillales bacterium]|nr:[protein-PII] uridylyltransferase [Rhodospirillales bacterium]MSP80182.1 [protein-PII] uridylyltransferase [Rhodospirillales bacterium]